jgi:hypothetical protein
MFFSDSTQSFEFSEKKLNLKHFSVVSSRCMSIFFERQKWNSQPAVETRKAASKPKSDGRKRLKTSVYPRRFFDFVKKQLFGELEVVRSGVCVCG